MPVISGVPPIPEPFLGRDELVDQYVEELLAGHDVGLSSGGISGVGLTSLASAIAQHPRVRSYYGDGVLWAGLGQHPDVPAILSHWANELGAKTPDRHENMKAVIGQRRMLVVIDDAWETSPAQVLRCGGPNCVHLLTSHYRAVARDFAKPEHYHLISELDPASSFQLLSSIAPSVCADEPELARQVALLANGIPLALRLVGGYLIAPLSANVNDSTSAPRNMSAPRSTPAALPSRQLLLQAQQRLGRREPANTSLAQSIALSLTGLPAQALRAFYDLGAFVSAPVVFTREAALAVTGADASTLDQLIARNLVEQTSRAHESVGTLAALGTTITLSMHPIIASVARVRRDPKTVARHRDYYLAYASEHRDDPRRIHMIYGQLAHAFTYAPDEPALLEFVWAARSYQESVGLQLEITRWTQRCISMPRIICANTSNNRSIELLELVNHALTIADHALDLTGEAGWHSHAKILFTIGSAYDMLDRKMQALQYYNRAWPIQEKYGDRDGLAVSLNNIGTIYYEQSLPGKALDFLKLSLNCRERNGEQTTAHYAQTLNNLGVIYTSLGMAGEALQHFSHSLEVHVKLGDLSGEALTRANLARFHQLRGPLHEAIAHLQRVVELDTLTGSPDVMRHQNRLKHLQTGFDAAQAVK